MFLNLSVPRFVGCGGSDSELEIDERGDVVVLEREPSIALFFPFKEMVNVMGVVFQRFPLRKEKLLLVFAGLAD